MTYKRATNAKRSASIELLFEPRDLWVGLYWTRKEQYVDPRITFYLCLVPCLPIKLSFPVEQDNPFDVEVDLNLNTPKHLF